MDAYRIFAKYYDELTKNVDYAHRAEKLDSLIKEYNKKAKLVLDLACGTGSLTLELLKLGYDVIGVDSSTEMLSIASKKCCGKALLLNQGAEDLDLYGTVDAVICMLDSVNHFKDKGVIMKVFEKMGREGMKLVYRSFLSATAGKENELNIVFSFNCAAKFKVRLGVFRSAWQIKNYPFRFTA